MADGAAKRKCSRGSRASPAVSMGAKLDVYHRALELLDLVVQVHEVMLIRVVSMLARLAGA